MPHGHCFLWQPDILWLHIIADAGIAAAYFAIPFGLAYFVRKRRDLPFPLTFLLFGAFILLCGTTHLMSIWVLWHPDYAIEGVIKALTAIVSILTFVVMARLIPKALLLTSSTELVRLNEDLQQANSSLETLYAQRRESDQMRLRLVMDNVVDAIITFDNRLTIESINPACERIFGYTPAEVIGKDITTLLPSSCYEEIFLMDMENGTGNRFEMPGKRKNDSVFPLDLSISPFVLAGERHFLVMARDITQRKQADEVRRLLASIVESSEDAIISENLDGQINSWNSAAERLLGYPAKVAIGQHITMIIPPERLEEEHEIISQIQTEKKIERMETQRLKKDGVLVNVSLTISPIRDIHGR